MEPVATCIMPTLNIDRAIETIKLAKETAGVETAYLLYYDFKPRGAVLSSNALFKAAMHMETPYIVYLNDDIVPKQQDWLRLLIEGIEQDKRYGVACPSGECSTAPQRSGKPGDTFKVHVINKPLAWFVAVIRRKCLKEVGFFNPDLIHYGDDSDWTQRAFKRGWKSVWVQGVYIKHLKQGGGEYAAPERHQWAKHDKAIYHKRWVKGKKRRA